MRLNRIVFMMVIVMGVTFAHSTYAADVAKIGIVDLQKILEKSEAGKVAQEDISNQGKKMKEELKGKEDEIVELKNRLEREAMVMSSEMREEKERDYRIKVNDLKLLQKKYLSEFKEIEKRLVGRLQKEIVEVVKELGKKEGYLMIIEKTVVLYYPNANDITDDVIKVYDAKNKKKK